MVAGRSHAQASQAGAAELRGACSLSLSAAMHPGAASRAAANTHRARKSRHCAAAASTNKKGCTAAALSNHNKTLESNAKLHNLHTGAGMWQTGKGSARRSKGAKIGALDMKGRIMLKALHKCIAALLGPMALTHCWLRLCPTVKPGGPPVQAAGHPHTASQRRQQHRGECEHARHNAHNRQRSCMLVGLRRRPYVTATHRRC